MQENLTLEFFPEDQRGVIKQLLDVHEMNLELDMRVCAGYYSHYALLSIDAELLTKQAILSREIHEAQLTKQLRAETILATKTREGALPTLVPTTSYDKEADLKRAYLRDETWIAIKQQELKQEYNQQIMTKIAAAFEMKAKMIQSLNRRQLAERKIENGGEE